jgi:hypothetical protein
MKIRDKESTQEINGAGNGAAKFGGDIPYLAAEFMSLLSCSCVYEQSIVNQALHESMAITKSSAHHSPKYGTIQVRRPTDRTNKVRLGRKLSILV